MIYVYTYISIVICFWLVNAFIAGLNETDTSQKDLFDSILWPVTLANLLGLLTKIIIKRKMNG